ncbi:MAG: FG-GAP repeat protein, partial [Bacteroidetes bacterium]|nr:FG-GAP repeat protein [Bacteroidota bacterium]
SLTVGDFNGDNYDDLAIGVPKEDVGAVLNAGAVNILYGSADGLQAALNQLWTQGDLGLADEEDDRFGNAVAAGDFNNDGYDDLAVGASREDLGSNSEGAVTIIYGTANGLEATDSQFWTQSSTGTGTNDQSDRFGFSLAVGNFDGDNYDDLAIGIRGEDIGGANAAGAVAVIYGTNTGLSSAASQLWSQDTPGIDGVAEVSDDFGFSLAAGDFDNDNFDDLAVGVPFEGVGAMSDAGAVNVIYGTAAGLSSTDNQLFSEDTAGIPLTVEANDNFGYSLAVGRLDQDLDDDLAIGVRFRDVGGVSNAGAILVIAGAAGGLDPSEAALVFTQDDAEVEGSAEVSDEFGHALATGDFDNDGIVDIAVSVPDELVDGEAEAGAVNILYGVFGGLDSSQLWFQGAMPVAIEPAAPGLPTTFALLPAYPNPFNPSTTLRYDVAAAGHVRITVFDALGREIALLVNEEHTAGRHVIAFDAEDLPSGLYLVRMEAGGGVQTQRVTLLK